MGRVLHVCMRGQQQKKCRAPMRHLVGDDLESVKKVEAERECCAQANRARRASAGCGQFPTAMISLRFDTQMLAEAGAAH
jgi:hypothetical protein